MLGDDVVDLRDPEAREASLHPRFDARVLAPEERGLLDASPDRTRLRWALWAAKEAAYKAARRLDAAVRFHPRAFVVRGDAVHHGGRRFRLRLEEAGGALHALALAGDVSAGRLAAGAARLAPGEEPGAAARALALRAAARLLDADPAELAVGRDGRLPRLLLRGEPAAASLSLSHHGRFAAFALALAEPRP
jgi:phosphopantetheinyl transferase (holo-ACP synthase)